MDAGTAVRLFIYLVVFALIVGLLAWAINYAQAKGVLTEWMANVLKVAGVFLIVLVLIGFLLSLAGHRVIVW